MSSIERGKRVMPTRNSPIQRHEADEAVEKTVLDRLQDLPVEVRESINSKITAMMTAKVFRKLQKKTVPVPIQYSVPNNNEEDEFYQIAFPFGKKDYEVSVDKLRDPPEYFAVSESRSEEFLMTCSKTDATHELVFVLSGDLLTSEGREFKKKKKTLHTTLMKVLVAVVRKYYPTITANDFVVIHNNTKKIPVSEYLRLFVNGPPVGGSQVLMRIRYNERIYKVHMKGTLKFIMSSKKTVYLSEIRGQYRYVK